MTKRGESDLEARLAFVRESAQTSPYYQAMGMLLALSSAASYAARRLGDSETASASLRLCDKSPGTSRCRPLQTLGSCGELAI